MENLKTDSHLPNDAIIQQSINECLPWVVENVAFPDGTEFRGKYKGYFYYGTVRNGVLALNGKEFLSPCAAALTITRTAIDGWLFWDCKLPGQLSWMSIYELKN